MRENGAYYMNTIYQKVSAKAVNAADADAYRTASGILQKGGLVAFPTETVYGLGGDGLRPDASRKIYAAKGRPSDNPLIIHIADFESLGKLTAEIPKAAYELAERYWPGPLTMVLPKAECVPYETTGGLDTVAIRMPNHTVALELIRQSGVCIAAPSANTSGRPSPTRAEHVAEDMDGRIDMILDGGEVGIGIESTIVDFTGEVPTILRPGYINQEMLEEVLGEVRIDPAILEGNQDRNLKPKAPGMKYRHYAPKGQLIIFEGNENSVVAEINRQAEAYLSEGKIVGIIATEETCVRYPKGIVKIIGNRGDEVSISRGLYRVLREFDTEGAQVILGESFEGGRLGQAIMNRMLKAAGHHVVRL